MLPYLSIFVLCNVGMRSQACSMLVRFISIVIALSARGAMRSSCAIQIVTQKLPNSPIYKSK